MHGILYLLRQLLEIVMFFFNNYKVIIRNINPENIRLIKIKGK